MNQEIQSNNKPRKGYIGWIILILIILGLTLPFHYVPGYLKMFPKDHFTFKHTIITQKDIDDVVDRYNNGNLFEKNAMNNDPFIRTLREQGIVVNEDKKQDDE